MIMFTQLSIQQLVVDSIQSLNGMYQNRIFQPFTSLSHSLSCSLTLSLTHTHSLSLSLSHSHTHSLSLSETHTRTYTHLYSFQYSTCQIKFVLRVLTEKSKNRLVLTKKNWSFFLICQGRGNHLFVICQFLICKHNLKVNQRLFWESGVIHYWRHTSRRRKAFFLFWSQCNVKYSVSPLTWSLWARSKMITLASYFCFLY